MGLLLPLWFSKNASSKKTVKLCFFVTFNTIICHIFPKKIHWNSSSRSEDMKNLSLNISYFHRFSSIFWIFLHFLLTKKLMASLITDDFSIFSLLTYFKEVVWQFYISSSGNIKGKRGEDQVDPPALPPKKKLPSKSPALLGLMYLDFFIYYFAAPRPTFGHRISSRIKQKVTQSPNPFFIWGIMLPSKWENLAVFLQN